MQLQMQNYGLGIMVITAWTGVASADFNQSSICKLLELDFAHLNKKKVMRDHQIDLMQGDFKKHICDPADLLVLVIDEVSFLVPEALHHIDIQLQRLRGVYDVPFGGVLIILAGDFLQKIHQAVFPLLNNL